MSRPARPRAPPAGGRPKAEDLARPRPGARRRRGAVRRAADGDRPAPEVAAAPQAEADPPRAQAHAGLRHARPDRGADLRRPGGGDDGAAGGADGQRRTAVRAPGHTFVGHFIGSPGHELPARRPKLPGAPAHGHALGARWAEYVPGIRAPNTGAGEPAWRPAVHHRGRRDIGTYGCSARARGAACRTPAPGGRAGCPRATTCAWLTPAGRHTCFYANEELVGMKPPMNQNKRPGS